MQLILCYVKSCGHRSRLSFTTPDCSYSKSIRLENVLTTVPQKVLARFFSYYVQTSINMWCCIPCYLIFDMLHITLTGGQKTNATLVRSWTKMHAFRQVLTTVAPKPLNWFNPHLVRSYTRDRKYFPCNRIFPRPKVNVTGDNRASYPPRENVSMQPMIFSTSQAPTPKPLNPFKSNLMWRY